MRINKCIACGTYTMKDRCPECGSSALKAKPPRFSPEDRYGRYRRMMKKLSLINGAAIPAKC